MAPAFAQRADAIPPPRCRFLIRDRERARPTSRDEAEKRSGACGTFERGMGTIEGAPLDRVAERRRAVALARHYREAEGLSIAQIAERLGRAPATVKGYFYDPSDANKGPSWGREAEPGGRELRNDPRAAASRGDVLPRRTLFCARLAVQHLR